MKMSSSDAYLHHEDVQLCQKTLAGMNAFRKCGKLCDVTLEVEGHNIPAHRVMLACSSSYLCEMFMSFDEDLNEQRHIKINHMDYDSLIMLINFIYTGRLDVPSEKVPSVYKAAKKLKMQSAADVCSRYLAEHLTPVNCIGIRTFASTHAELTSQTDLYIQNNLDQIMNSSREFFALKKLRFNILGVDDARLTPGSEKVMCDLVIRWLQQTVTAQDIDAMNDEPHLLFLNAEGSLCDCLSLNENSPLCLDSAVRDYRNLGKCKQLAPVKGKEPKSPGGHAHQNGHNSHSNGRTKPDVTLPEWSLVAWRTVAERVCICIAVLDNRLVTMSLKLQNHLAVVTPETNGDSCQTNSCSSSPTISNSLNGHIEFQMSRSLLQVAHMSSARCGMGVVVLDKQLIVLGGYDRGECLNSVEAFDMLTNSWTTYPHMLQARGRFNATALDGKIVACGGSTGSDDLKSVESYDPNSGKWSPLPDMLAALSNAGVAVLNDKLYVIGGSQGRTATPMCQVYDPKSNKWSKIADLKTGRSQAGVCVLGNKLIAVGGSDFMNCLNSVEIYNPDSDEWEDTAPMITARRGAGIASFMGRVYVVGGSDGQSSLTSVEIFDPVASVWSVGSSLNMARANVGLALYSKHLFAIGGYNGKTFLDSVEYLVENGHEWTLFMPTEQHMNGLMAPSDGDSDPDSPFSE